MPRPVITTLCSLPLCLAVLAGCSPKQAPARADFWATDTAGRVPALVDAAGQNDDATLAELVHALSDEDPAVRLFAIQALNQRTGQTLGYRYYDSAERRRDATRQWHAWLSRQDDPNAPATADANP